MTVVLDWGLVRYVDIADIADSMISSMNLSGPVSAVDSALDLCSTIALQRGRENSSLAAETSESCLNWLFHGWKPSKIHFGDLLAALTMAGLVQDRLHTAVIAQECPAQSIMILLEICTGHGYHPPWPIRALLHGPLSRARCKTMEDLDIIHYLLLNTESKPLWDEPQTAIKTADAKMFLTGPKKQMLVTKVLDYSMSETLILLEAMETSPQLKNDAIGAMTTLCIITSSMLTHPHAQKYHRLSQLRNMTEKLLQNLIRNIRPEDKQPIFSNGIFEAFAKVLPSLSDLLGGKGLLFQGIIALLRESDSDAWLDLSSEEHSETSGAQNGRKHFEEDFEEDFESQASNPRSKVKDISVSHDAALVISDAVAFRTSLVAKLCFISSSDWSIEEQPIRPTLTEIFASFLVSLPQASFISCRSFLQDLFEAEPIVGVQEAAVLLKYLNVKLLRRHTFQRSESAMGVTLDVVSGLVVLWTNLDNTDVYEAGAEIYDWFVTTILDRRLASSHVLMCLSVLLQRLIRTSPDYYKNLELPSARTSLFKILEDGNLDVKFFVGSHISDIFGLFVLREHENILEDVIEILPKAVDWPDGIALRLYVLYRLAQSWPTLLRRCVYAIYEIPGAVPASAGHAQWCLNQVSQTLQLQDPQELFKLFASQILYTWLETQSLQTIPFAVFGYKTLKELLTDVRGEVAGQVTMRQNDGEESQVTQGLGKPFEELLEESIGKVAAYSIAQDLAVLPSKDKHALGAEAHVRRVLGKDRYATLVASNLHEVLLTLLKSMDEEKGIEKAFARNPTYSNAHAIYQSIKSISASTEALPISQQPSFKARYLPDELAYVCRRANVQIESLWSPSLYVYLFRGLLDTLHPALGTQHACSTIRKLRVLVSVAGPTALESYPLEMALQSLRPFLTNTHCSEDSIGILQYLLTAGETHLKSNPTFVAGLGVVTLTSLKAFLGSAQESTTQESQFKATMKRASVFHTWLADYLSKHTSGNLSESSTAAFKRMIEAARNVRTSGNAQRGSPESDLLLSLLEDAASGTGLLNRASRELILQCLCAEFDLPSSFREDIMGSDNDAARICPVLWRAAQAHDYGEKFNLWLGRVLGRAYAATGVAEQRMTLEIDPDFEAETLDEGDVAEPRSSESRILQTMGDVLQLGDAQKTGVIERTLRLILTQAVDTHLFTECEESLTTSVIVGLLWRDFECPQHSPVTFPQTNLEDIATSFEEMNAQEWVQRLCIALTMKTKDDMLLSKLPHLLLELTTMCDRLVPFIVHLTLCRESKGHQGVRQILSTAYRRLFDNTSKACIRHTRLALKTLLYLRKQPLPRENNKSDRSQWLSIDYSQAASAAVRCSMYKTALLFLDIGYSEVAEASRRSSAAKVREPTEMLLQIYKNIDEPDGFYGVQQPSSLASMMARLEYERAGFKSLSMRGAHYDSELRLSPAATQADEEGMVQALERLNLNGLSQSLLGRMTNLSPSCAQTMHNTARKLEQWDLSAPVTHINHATSVFRVFQSINNAPRPETFIDSINAGFSETMTRLMSSEGGGPSIHETLKALAILAEIDEVCSIQNIDQLEDVWLRFEERERWMYTER